MAKQFTQKQMDRLEDYACDVLDNMDTLEIYPQTLQRYQVKDIIDQTRNKMLSDDEADYIVHYISSNY